MVEGKGRWEKELETDMDDMGRIRASRGSADGIVGRVDIDAIDDNDGGGYPCRD